MYLSAVQPSVNCTVTRQIIQADYLHKQFVGSLELKA
jgi:hypothetical protein